MKILHLACLNNDPEIQPNMDPKCNPVGGEPRNLNLKKKIAYKIKGTIIIPFLALIKKILLANAFLCYKSFFLHCKLHCLISLFDSGSTGPLAMVKAKKR